MFSTHYFVAQGDNQVDNANLTSDVVHEFLLSVVYCCSHGFIKVIG